MSFTYNVETSLGRVRMLITDRDEAYPIFQDSEIEAFLAMEGDSVFLGAALALETIGRNETLILKVMKLLDLTTDGAKVGAELRASAAALRKRVADELALVEVGSFGIAEMINTPTAWEEKFWKDAMRSGPIDGYWFGYW